jgi:hypothetical protein
MVGDEQRAERDRQDHEQGQEDDEREQDLVLPLRLAVPEAHCAHLLLAQFDLPSLPLLERSLDGFLTAGAGGVLGVVPSGVRGHALTMPWP